MNYTIDRGMRILPETSWRPVLQRSIDAFYEGKKDEGIAACLTLLNEPMLPEDIRDLTFRNQTFYAVPLDELVPGARWEALEVGGPEGEPPDPSPAATAERLAVVVRGEPGVRPIEGHASIPAGPERELLVVPDETVNGLQLSQFLPYFADDVLHAAALVRNWEADKHVRAGVMRFAGDGREAPHLLGPRAGHFRQGWSPLVTDGGPRFVAWWEPTEVFRFDGERGEFARVALRMAPHIAERFQGGSQGVPAPGGYLFLVNESATFDDGNEVRLSRFVRIDEGFQVTDLSPQFYLAERGKDVATGLARQGERLVAGFTSGGTTALLATMELEGVLGSLMPVDAPGRKRE